MAFRDAQAALPRPTWGLTRRQVLGGVAAGGAALLWPGGAAAHAPAVRFAYQTNLWGAPAIFAVEEGLFEKAGLKLDYLRVDVGKGARDALVSGQADIGTFGATPFIVGAVKGEMAAIALVCNAGETEAVVVKADSPYRTLGDLKGKRIASAAGSITNHLFVNRVGPLHGLKKGDYELVNLRFQDQPAALAAGSVDAFVGLEPYVAVIEHQGIGRALVRFGKWDKAPNLMVASTKFLERNFQVAVTFLRAYLEGVRQFNNQRPRAVDLLHRFYRGQGYDVPRVVIEAAVGRIEVTPELAPDLEAYLNEQGEELLKGRNIPRLPDWGKSLRRDLLAQAQK